MAKYGVTISLTYPYTSQSKGQTTCRCKSYKFPHRLGSGGCEFNEDPARCPSCIEGYCEYHECDDGYDPRDEALTASQRNPSILTSPRSYWK